MQKKHAILITPETHLVDDVHAYLWNADEIYQRLLNEHEIVYRHIPRTGDTIVLDGFLNSAETGKAFRSDGFELFGEKYYGNGLIIAADDTLCRPHVSPQDISHCIRFFRPEPAQGYETRQSAHAA
ncbi:MAG: hypothetical protein P4L99_04510 [Chthoniobacter sp.]|nr:hypothetical protein [Chthoniobacter sp.]